MPLFHPTNRVFSAIADALGFLETNSATTLYENGPVRPRLDVGKSIEQTAVWRTFLFAITEVGAATAITAFDFYTALNWDTIEVRNRASDAFVVPATHECYVVGVGARCDVNAALNSVSVRRRRIATAGETDQILFFGDNSELTTIITRNATHDDPVLRPLPWYFPPLGVQNAEIVVDTDLSAAATLFTVFQVLSAPPGVFTRMP